MSKKEPKVAIVHDWLVGYAGGDRVVDAMKRVFPDAVIYTLVYDPNNMPEHFKSYDIRTSWFQKVPFSNRLYKAMLPLMPRAFEAFDLTEYDLVLSSSSSCSKGVITRPDAVHICYCHTPIRYVWDFYYTYRANANWLAKLVMPGQMHKMRIWDKCAADRVDYFIANSHYIAQRIKKYYRRDSDVIYPCCHINESPFVEKEDFYLTVGRLTWYKRVDLAVQACTRLNKRLVVIGGGGELDKLRAMAGPTVEFKGGGLSDEEVRSYYLRAKGFLFPGEEDFGITPVEAQSAGTPVLAYGRGGACESVLPGRTGYWFKEQTVESLADCIERFERDGVACSKEEIREHSRSFSEERFERELKEYCLRRMADWQQGLLPLGEGGTGLNPIVINGTVLCDNITGIPRYVYENVIRLDKLIEGTGLDVRIAYRDDGRPIHLPELKNIRLVPLKSIPYFYNLAVLPAYLRRTHAFYVGLASDMLLTRRSVVVLHDIRPLVMDTDKGFFRFKFWVHCLSTKWFAQRMFTVSDNQRHLISEKLGIPLDKIGITYNGWEHMKNVTPDESIFDKMPGVKKGEYFYALGSLAKHKNFKWIREVARRSPDKTFVVAGGKDLRAFGDDAEAKDTHNVFYPGYVSDAENAALMKHCKLFLHPAVFEGFGIPPLEALALGAPVALANATCLPELYGDTARYFDPYDYDVDLDALAAQPVAAPDEVLKKYSWDKTAAFWLHEMEKYANQ